MSLIFYRYITNVFLERLLVVSVAIILAFGISNIFDILNRFSGVKLTPILFAKLVMLKLPYLLIEVVPFICLLSTLMTYNKLSAANELNAFFSAGISIVQITVIPVIVSLLLGVVIISSVNPISTMMLSKIEHIEATVLGKLTPHLTLANFGVVAADYAPNQNHILVAKSVDVATNKLIAPSYFLLDKTNNYQGRIEAKSALLENQQIIFTKVTYFHPDGSFEHLPSSVFDSSLSIARLLDGIIPPEHFDFWHLPAAIISLNNSGLPSIQHQLYYYKLLFKPLSMMAGVLLAACFINRTIRPNSRFPLFALGIFIGLVNHLVMEILVKILAFSGLGLLWSTLSPLILVILLSSFIILHLHTT